jgi:Family of unknown function (DUF6325)
MLERPLEYALIEFKGNKFSGKIVPELLDLADRGIVRFVDIVFIQKEKDGNVRTVELNDLDAESYKMFVPIGKHVASLFTQGDLEKAAGKLKKNTAAALFLWENLWLDNIRKALTDSGGKLIERAQIPAETVKKFKKNHAEYERKQAAARKKNAASKKKNAAAKKASPKAKQK